MNSSACLRAFLFFHRRFLEKIEVDAAKALAGRADEEGGLRQRTTANDH